MTNEELKKKIVDILNKIFTERDVIPVHTAPDGKKTTLPDELCEIFNNIVVQAVIPYFADALIDANIFVDIDTFKDEKQSMNGILTSMSSYMNYKLHELERRAEVAEKALKNRAACHILKQFPNETDELENLTQEVYEAWIEQAEKELAEEGKDD